MSPDQGHREALVRTAYVASAYVVCSARVLLIRHRALERWLAPGGHIQAGETPDQCAMREVREETGVSAKIVEDGIAGRRYDRAEVTMLARPLVVQLEEITPDLRHIDFIYVATAYTPDLRPQASEIDDAVWADERQMRALHVPENVIVVARMALECVEADQ
jgi:8-oxo-dGTP pyrophosphatase MutT (NUDIX family)